MPGCSCVVAAGARCGCVRAVTAGSSIAERHVLARPVAPVHVRQSSAINRRDAGDSVTPSASAGTGPGNAGHTKM